MTTMSKKKLLDNGYLVEIEHWGSDERIVEAARMSNDKGFLGWGPKDCPTCCGLKTHPMSPFEPCPECKGLGFLSGDEKLLAYLWNHKHATPFEMAGLVIEVKAPIMVFREWHRHRTQSYNEMSARYVPLPDENYVPSVERCMIINTKNKQAGKIASAVDLTGEAAAKWIQALEKAYDAAEKCYQEGLNAGIPKELARLIVPVGRYSKMRACTNLRNWLAFMTLRSALDAQYEIRQYSDAIGEIIAEIFPRTWALFCKKA